MRISILLAAVTVVLDGFAGNAAAQRPSGHPIMFQSFGGYFGGGVGGRGGTIGRGAASRPGR